MLTRRRLLLALTTVALGALTAGAWYVWTKGFTRSWRARIAQEFAKQGIELTLRRLTLDPFRGLVAQEVRLLDGRDHRRVLAVMDEMQLGVNYAAAFRGERFLDFVDTRDAHLSLPLDASRSDSPTIEISKLNARLFLPPQQLYVARAEFEVLGVQVYATGRLINPQEYGSDAGRRSTVQEQAQRALALLSSLRFRGAPPVLSVEFSGDLEKPEEVAVDARFYAEAVKRQTYSMQQVSALASFRGGVLELHQLSAKDGHGELRASATYQPHSGKISARLQSSLAAPEFLHAYTEIPMPTQLVLTSAPKLDLSLEGVVARRYDWSVFGHVGLERFALHGVPFRSFFGDVSWSGGRWSLRDFQVQHLSGTVQGDAVSVPGDFRAQVHGSINPRALVPLLHSTMNDWLAKFEFVDSPTLDLDVRGTAPGWATCSASGQVHLGRAIYEGVPTQSFTTELRYGDETLSLSPFRPPQGDEPPTDLIFDLRKREVRLEKRETGETSTNAARPIAGG